MLSYFEKYDTILFDLDGTLIDSAESLVAALNNTIIDILPSVIPIGETVRQLAGIGSRNLLRYAFEYHNKPYTEQDIENLVPDFLNAYEKLHHQTEPFDGATNLLKDLKAKNKNLLLATNKPKRFTHPIMDNLNWTSLFDGIYCPEDVSQKKPNPAHLLEALANSNISTHNALMVGDSITDYHAALNAHISVMMVCFNGQTKQQFPNADYFIDDFTK